MRVSHVTRDYPPHSGGGISTAVHGLVEASAAGGIESPVLVISVERAGDGREERLGSARVVRVREAEEARSLLEAEDADVVHVHDAMLIHVAEGLPARIVYTAHVAHAALNEARGFPGTTRSLVAQQRALDAAHVVTAPSAAAARMLGVPWVRVTPLGLDVPAAQVPASGPPTLLFVGRFEETKGVFAAIDVAVPLLRERPELTLELVGGLPAHPKADRRARRLVERQIPDDVRGRIRLPGWLGGAALDAAYARATVVLQPSAIETVGLAVLEAMARGRAVVTTRCGGPEEHIIDGLNGRLVPVGDLDAARGAVLRLLDDDGARASMETAARSAARAWSWEAALPHTLAAYTAEAARWTRARRG